MTHPEVFSDQQVKNLNLYQQSGVFHPFTCGNDSCRDILIAKTSGWVCPSCDYTQNWAHEFMLNFSVEKLVETSPFHAALVEHLKNDQDH